MTAWHFVRRSGPQRSIDATAIRRRDLAKMTLGEIESLPMVADGNAVALGELFSVVADLDASDQVVIEGDLKNVHGIAAGHDQGEFLVRGSAGNGLGSGMTGGSVLVEGDVGNFLAEPIGAHKIGMSGGSISVTGNAGDYAGHRMRRGTIVIGGSVGAMLAASMVAGTIFVAGPVGENVGVGMKRGSLLLANADEFVAQADADSLGACRRFSTPQRFEPSFLALYQDPRVLNVIGQMQRLPLFRTRADRSVGGQAEILFTVSAATACGIGYEESTATP
ncbi:hypothetical protein NHH03_01775 [Stieleria sp. TO1_6]|uniref:GltB/FmdC/FwdC-like GXGXG domain-containing protein n=1 Tax=Stieleria tagensis TaxID=2956795 RepID=UPI00209AEEBC|nr:hypothetical protein [Stieleria tagensis]MCO8120449.1 hypothetical protein [Stieleria tagensis]